MSILDILLVIPLAWGAYKGFSKGFFHAAAMLAGVIAGIYFAAIVADIAARVIIPIVDWNPMLIKIIFFVFAFLLIVIAFSALGALLTKLSKIVFLNIVNRVAGLFFGIIKYAFILSILLIIINYINKYNEVLTDSAKQGSYLYEYIEPLAPMIIPHKDLILRPDSIQFDLPPMKV